MWAREPGFPTLVYIILEQQVSLASAKAAFTKLKQAASPLTPQAFLKGSYIFDGPNIAVFLDFPHEKESNITNKIAPYKSALENH